jgi:hypothetical protein
MYASERRVCAADGHRSVQSTTRCFDRQNPDQSVNLVARWFTKHLLTSQWRGTRAIRDETRYRKVGLCNYTEVKNWYE